MSGAEQERVFHFLAQAVGTEREVVGVEISQDLAAIARKRIEQEKWKNIHVAVGPAQTIPSQVGLMACCCSQRTRCLPRQKPWIICFSISKSRGRLWHSGPNCQTRDEAD